MTARGGGFSLLEVLLALVILGGGLVTLARIGSAGPLRAEELQGRLLADMVAADLAVELRLGLREPDGADSRGERRLAQRRFGFRITRHGADALRIDVGRYPRTDGLVTLTQPLPTVAP